MLSNEQLVDWGALSPLRLRAKEATAGLYAGAHRSHRRGTGIEFDSHRDYVPGDDLRRLDVRALMRHERLLVKQFETETDRRLCLLVDATLSMAFASARAPASKLAYAGLLAAALTRITTAGGDLVSLDWLGGANAVGLPAMGGRMVFERVVEAFERLRAREGADDGDEGSSASGLTREQFERRLYPVSRAARRGSVIVLLSDLIDLPEPAAVEFAALGNRQRSLVAVRILDPVEATFPFQGPVKLKPSTSGTSVETDASEARAGYLRALREQSERWRRELVSHNGRLVECQTTDAPVEVLRRILNLTDPSGNEVRA